MSVTDDMISAALVAARKFQEAFDPNLEPTEDDLRKMLGDVLRAALSVANR